MNESWLDLLCCPTTRQPLRLENAEIGGNGLVVSGVLRTERGVAYPIVRGVPRFVPHEMYSGSFGYEWQRWPRVQFEDQNVGKPMQGHTTRMWDHVVDGSVDLHDKTIVDFGCGSGRFLDVVRRRGGRVVGIDLSLAVDAARTNFADDPDVLIVQADLLNPPFAEGVFDGGYTIGVLHHTPDPAAGLKALAQIVRPGGWVACCVYTQGEFYDYPSVRRFRRVHQIMHSWAGYHPALAYAQASAYVLSPVMGLMCAVPLAADVSRWLQRHLMVCLTLPDKRWSVLDIFDAITPAIASTHSSAELIQWFANAGCRDITPTRWCSTSFKGIRQ